MGSRKAFLFSPSLLWSQTRGVRLMFLLLTLHLGNWWVNSKTWNCLLEFIYLFCPTIIIRNLHFPGNMCNVCHHCIFWSVCLLGDNTKSAFSEAGVFTYFWVLSGYKLIVLPFAKREVEGERTFLLYLWSNTVDKVYQWFCILSYFRNALLHVIMYILFVYKPILRFFFLIRVGVTFLSQSFICYIWACNY